MTIHVQHFSLPTGALIEYEGQSVVVAGLAKDGIIVRDRYVGDSEEARYFVIQDSKVRELLSRLDVTIDTDFSSDTVDRETNTNVADDGWLHAKYTEHRLAQQREAWCLAAQSILKGGSYTPTSIIKNYDKIRERAFDRQRLLALGSDKDGEFPAKTWGAKSVSNYCKLYFGMEKPHPKVFLPKKLKGNTLPRLTLAEDVLLDKCCQKYLSKAQPSKTSIVKLVTIVFAKENCELLEQGRGTQLTVPHPNTVYRRLNKFNALQLVLGREGVRAAQKEFSPTQHGVRALKIGEMVELDFWTGDVMTFAKKSAFWDLLTPDLQKDLANANMAKKAKGKGRPRTRQRLFICAAIDVATRGVLGVGVSEKPNARTVIEVLDMIGRDKSDISCLAGCRMPWHQHSGIGTIIVDTGPEFFNEEVQAAVVALGASIVYGRAGVPTDKPFVERLFGGFRTRFADSLPGKTGYSVDCLVDYDSEKMAAFNADELRHLIIRFIVDEYHLEPHSGLMNKRPVDAWKHHERYGIVHPAPPRIRRNATGVRMQRMLSKEGLRICGIPFGDQEALSAVLKRKKRKVEVRIDPNDLREVTAIVDGKPVHLTNQRQDLAKFTLRTWMAAIKEMTRTRPQDRVFYEHVLLEHTKWFQGKIASAVEKHGLPSTEIDADTLSWFENSFCFKLQIDADPEAVFSADLETLLADGEGNGIHTAEDIAAEKAAYFAKRSNSTTTSNLEPGSMNLFAAEGGQEAQELPPTAAAGDPPTSWSDSPTNVSSVTDQSSTSSRFSGAPKGKGTLT
ncbi:MAG: hypothetical protein ABJN39_19565 [Sulfitobacter sp.]|uniref:hypothetical protein n=1 Tax=Alphaproteobacteria TaxID=28211 RepID=UPI00329A098F